LVDTLALREELRLLNSSFTNPSILKVRWRRLPLARPCDSA
jgi:hypothetical protein